MRVFFYIACFVQGSRYFFSFFDPSSKRRGFRRFEEYDGIYARERGDAEMIAFERRFDIIVYIIKNGFVTSRELCIRFGVADSTIRQDMNTLSQHYPITPMRGNGGGFTFSGKKPVFINHADMLMRLSESIQKTGGIDGYDDLLMKETIRVLLAIEVHSNRVFL